MDLFKQWLDHIPKPVRVLDVGGTPQYWEKASLPEGIKVHIFNIQAIGPILPGFTFEIGDACNLSKWNDGEWDVVHSNSVIGHVGSFERQQTMAAEVRRVGKSYFLQTPNKNFPIDWRTFVPFFHWLPTSVRARVFRICPVGRYKRTKDNAEAEYLANASRDLNLKELKKLFPDGTFLYEKVFGVAKSFIIHRVYDFVLILFAAPETAIASTMGGALV